MVAKGKTSPFFPLSCVKHTHKHIISCYLIYILANKEVLGQNLLINTAVQVGGGYDEFSHIVL